MKSGVNPSLHPGFHYYTTFAKFNVKKNHPLPYEQEICHYQNTNNDQITRAISEFPFGQLLFKYQR